MGYELRALKKPDSNNCLFLDVIITHKINNVLQSEIFYIISGGGQHIGTMHERKGISY